MNPICSAFACVVLLAPSALSRPAQGALYTWPTQSSAVAPAGDVDGDGTGDFATNVEGLAALPGAVRLLSGANGAELRRVAGSFAGDGFGAVLVPLGDVDQDGHDDLAVGASPSDPALLGYVRLISGASGAALWQVPAPAIGIWHARSAARVEDLDQDGVDDLVVGSLSTVAGAPGRALVHSGASGAVLFELAAVTATDLFGWSVASAGDVDGDGRADLLVGDPSTVGGVGGRVTLHSGADGAELRRLDAPPGLFLYGTSVASLGDQDGDGLREVLVGAPGTFLENSSGRALLHSGADGALLRTFEPSQPNLVWYGQRVAAFQDLDGDGREDAAVQAIFHRNGCCAYGAAELIIHSTRSGAELYVGGGHTAPFARVPDANGDGIDDYLLAGTTLVLPFQPPPADIAWLCAASFDPLGCAAYLETSGTPSLTLGDDLAVRAQRAAPQGVGFLGWSTRHRHAPFGGGTFCLRSPVFRTTALAVDGGGQPCPNGTGETGTFAHTIEKPDLAALGLAPGESFFVQGWFRDPNLPAPDDLVLTTGILVTIWP